MSHQFVYVTLTKINTFARDSFPCLLLQDIFLDQLLLDISVTLDCICLVAKCARGRKSKPGKLDGILYYIFLPFTYLLQRFSVALTRN